jgi:predicted adenine nucleotide alpha hydrolase (AANH) superfamily ATPase
MSCSNISKAYHDGTVHVCVSSCESINLEKSGSTEWPSNLYFNNINFQFAILFLVSNSDDVTFSSRFNHAQKS